DRMSAGFASGGCGEGVDRMVAEVIRQIVSDADRASRARGGVDVAKAHAHARGQVGAKPVIVIFPDADSAGIFQASPGLVLNLIVPALRRLEAAYFMNPLLRLPCQSPRSNDTHIQREILLCQLLS